MAGPLLNDDIIVESAVKIPSSEATGYPYGLTEEQVMKLIYFFGMRKASQKALGDGRTTKVKKFTADEKKMVQDVFGWFGMVAETELQWKSAYRAVTARYKAICDFLKAKPAFITPDIHRALDEYGYKGVLRNIVTVVDKEGNIRQKVATNIQKKTIAPLGQMEAIMWNFQNVALSKLMLIIESITPADVKKSNLGMKSKAARDIYSVIHMARLANKNPNMSLVQVNINADPKEKLHAYSSYVTKNRETSSS